MNYTEKYHLPQWEETDRIMRTDFNQMCADMEAGLTENAQAAEEAAQLPYVVGRYVGSGFSDQDIALGFRPSFVLIFCSQSGVNVESSLRRVTAVSDEITSEGATTITDTGFHLRGVTSVPYPNVNRDGTIYNYIAFR